MVAFLDPTAVENACDEPQPVGEIPQVVRKFGYVPDLVPLRPGDLVLVSARKPSYSSTAIQEYNKSLFDDRFSIWTHAAIHAEGGKIVEALPGGVIPEHIYKYVPTHKIAIRRYKNMRMADRLRIALYASLEIGKKYEYQGIFQFALRNFSTEARRKYFTSKYMICSELYMRAFIYGANKPLANVPIDGTVTPAHLAACPDLVDIDINWIQLPSVEPPR